MNSIHIIIGLKILVIMILLPAGSLLGQSASFPPQEQPQEQPQDLAQTFEALHLSAEQLLSFESRSRQLIREFVDYYELLRTASEDAEMEAILRTQLGQLLHPGSAALHLHGLSKTEQLATINFAEMPSLEIQSINLLRQEAKGSSFIWQYQIKLNVAGQSKQALVSTMLSRHKKTFGEATREVWKVAIASWERH